MSEESPNGALTGVEKEMESMSFKAINESNTERNEDPTNGTENSGKRRGSLERYRPGAYCNEERERHRRRGHFGENRLTGEQDGAAGQSGNKPRSGRKNAKNRRSNQKKDQPTEAQPEKRNWADDSLEEQKPDSPPEKPEQQGRKPRNPDDLRHKLNQKRNNHESGGKKLFQGQRRTRRTSIQVTIRRR